MAICKRTIDTIGNIIFIIFISLIILFNIPIFLSSYVYYYIICKIDNIKHRGKRKYEEVFTPIRVHQFILATIITLMTNLYIFREDYFKFHNFKIGFIVSLISVVSVTILYLIYMNKLYESEDKIALMICGFDEYFIQSLKKYLKVREIDCSLLDFQMESDIHFIMKKIALRKNQIYIINKSKLMKKRKPEIVLGDLVIMMNCMKNQLSQIVFIAEEELDIKIRKYVAIDHHILNNGDINQIFEKISVTINKSPKYKNLEQGKSNILREEYFGDHLEEPL